MCPCTACRSEVVSTDAYRSQCGDNARCIRRFKVASSVLALASLVCLFAQSAFCQSKENIPIPEYFGIYAVLDGKLIKLDSDQVHLENRITVRLGVRHAVGNILQGQPLASSQNENIPSFTPDFKIVVFSEPSGMQSPLAVAKTLHLESLVFVRNLLVDTGWPQNLRRSGPENGWESGDAPELGGIATGDRANALEFLVKPMAGRADIVIAALSEPLKPGVYRLSAGPSAPLFRRGGFLFGVEPIQQGEAIKCVDATVTYAMNMSKSKYTPCGPGVGPPPVSAMPTPNATSASATACADYDACLLAGAKALLSSDWRGAITDFE